MANRDNMHYTHGSFFVAALKELCPITKGEWALLGDDDYDNVTFTMNDGETAPTKEQVDTRTQELKDLWEHNRYQRERKYDYPDLGEFADAYYWAQKGDNTKMDEYVAKCDAVKTAWPKPSEQYINYTDAFYYRL